MTDEIQLLRELGDEIPRAEHGRIRDIYARATRSEGTFGRRWLHRAAARPRYAAAFTAVTVAAAAAIALPIAFGHSGAGHSTSSSSAAPGRHRAGPAVPRSVSVASIDEANVRLPFEAVLPSNVAPADGIQVPIAGESSDSSGWLTAKFDTDAGTYLLSESSSNATVETLQQWAAASAENCPDCAQQVVIEDGVHVLVLDSPVFGLRLQWVRGDGTSPVLTELDWSRNMPENNGIPSQDAALLIASDIIRQGG